jgi:hypothetical protein
VPKIGAVVWWSSLDRTAEAKSELLDGERGEGRKQN